jgi:hypothetical protein
LKPTLRLWSPALQLVEAVKETALREPMQIGSRSLLFNLNFLPGKVRAFAETRFEKTVIEF